MEVRSYPDPVLRVKAAPVTAFDQALADLVQEMTRTMHEANGLGLAAPQVGVSTRIAIVSPDSEAGHEAVLVNPEITETDGWVESEEGCLSFPGVYVKIGRFARVRVKHQDVRGEVHEMEAESLLARAVQHELDHLDGRLLMDRMSSVQRLAQRRRLRELQDRYERRTSRAGAGSSVAS